jgi:S-adenosylmethionine synthetase
VAYAIGVAKPVGLYVNTYGTARVGLSDGDIAKRVEKLFDMRPGIIVRRLGLKNPIFSATSNYGHMGRTPYKAPVTFIENGQEVSREVEFFAWEKLDYVDAIREAFQLS